MEQIKPRSTLPRGKKEGGLTVKLFKGHYTSLATWPLMGGQTVGGVFQVKLPSNSRTTFSHLA
ncbi:MAG: hypothetical protein ACREYE_02865 [Gammaproteobacteria bacterium]